MASVSLFSCLSLLFLSINFSQGKYVEGEINTLEDWEFITRFCFLSKKGTLRFTFEYPIAYGPQHILLYFDTPDQWDAVYKSDKTCSEKVAVLSVENNQIINLTTSYGLSGCTISNEGQYICNGGRIFRSARERWWFIAVSRCDRDPTYTCEQKLMPLSESQNIEMTTSGVTSGCVNKKVSDDWNFYCKGGRMFRSSRERWWYIAVSRCERNSSDTCAEKVSVLNPLNNQIIYLTTHYSLSGCAIKNTDGVDMYVCSGGRRFSSVRERWWFIAVSRCDPTNNPNCTEREAVMNPSNNQIITLMPGSSSSGCQLQTIDGIEKYYCTERRVFASARERWWYIAASHCQPLTPVGINLKYKIHMTNGPEDDYLHREYSADEFYILPIDIAFLIAYVLLCILTIICAVLLRNRQLWHTTYKMYMVSVFLWTFYLFLMCIGYGIYGNDGLEWKLRSTKYAARAFESVSIMVFLLMLILIGKGYTITRGRLSTASTIKISVFMTLYAIVYIIIFIWEAIIFDPGLVLYLYESPPGYSLIAMRIIGFIWFCYAIFFTLKHYPEKGPFYYPLFVFYTLWFWAGPIVTVIAMSAIALWSREKTVVGVENFVALCGHFYFMVWLVYTLPHSANKGNRKCQFWAGPIVIVIAMTSIALWTREKTVAGVENFVAFVGHVFFLVLTRPSAANKNFPYHVRTTQIGILQNVPHQHGSGAPDTEENFGGHAYSISSPMPGSSSGPDLTSLFTTSQTTKKQREAETSLNSNGLSNGTVDFPPAYNSFKQPRMVESMSRGRINSSAHLIGHAEDVDEVDELPVVEPSVPPPSYEDMFRARGSMSQ